MKKVSILMSTYNGEKYLEKQLESLFTQTYENIEIHVRDDGSSDRTLEILTKYENEGKIHLCRGSNVGYKKSYYWLLMNCSDADYVAYCDQDDIWFPDKIERAVSALEHYSDEPALYISNFYWCDEHCMPQKANDAHKKEHDLIKFITRGDANCFGFCEVFNRNAVKAIRGRSCVINCAHDEVIYQYCLCNGIVLWGDEPMAYYRRYGNNVSPQEYMGGTYFRHLIWKIKTFLLRSNKKDIYLRAEEFLGAFEDILPSEDIQVFKCYIGTQNRLKKALRKKRYRDTLFDELSIRIMFLLGRV